MLGDMADAIHRISGIDLASLGMVSRAPNLRTPREPEYKVDRNVFSPFSVYWGYWYTNKDADAFALKQNVDTGWFYGLVSRDQTGRCVILNGLRVSFYEEDLHPSCKIIEVGSVSGPSIQTSEVSEAVKFLTTLRPEWKGFIEQSVLMDMVRLRGRRVENDFAPASWEQNILRRVLEVTNFKPTPEEIIDLDPSLAPEQEFAGIPDSGSPDPTAPPPPRPKIFPDWPPFQPSDVTLPLSIADDILNPPTRDDKELLVQLVVQQKMPMGQIAGQIIGDVVIDPLSNEDLKGIKEHAFYWMKTIGHNGNDVHSIAHGKDGVEIALGLKISEQAGNDPRSRKDWLENSFNALKVQIETGTRQKSDGTAKVPAMPGMRIAAGRCAYS
jgi:hypothetical protein